MVIRGKYSLRRLLVKPFACAQPSPQIIWRWKCIQIVVAARQEIMFDDTSAVRRISELEAQNLSVLFGLLSQSIARS